MTEQDVEVRDVAHRSIPEADYRALPGLSGTGIAKLLRSPALYRESVVNPKPPTDAMRVGTAIHNIALEGGERVAVVMEVTKNAGRSNAETLECRDWTLTDAKAQREDGEAAGYIVVNLDEAELLAEMIAALHRHAEAAEILFGEGESEVTVIWDHEGQPMKGRIDRVREGRVVDLKSISVRYDDDFEEACHKAIGANGVHFQLIHYRMGLERSSADHPLNVAPVAVYVERDFPHRVAVIELSEEAVRQGLEGCFEAYRRHADCTEADSWPEGSPEGTQASRIPLWVMRGWDRAINGTQPSPGSAWD